MATELRGLGRQRRGRFGRALRLGASIAIFAPALAAASGPLAEFEIVDLFRGAQAGAPAAGHNPRFELALFFGGRGLDDGEWGPVDEQPVTGVQFSVEPEGAPVGFEFGFLVSTTEDEVFVSGVGDVDVDARIAEGYAGVHKRFGAPDSTFRPYVGAGLSLLTAELDSDAGGSLDTDHDAFIGLYAHGGVAVRATEWLRLGLDLRLLGASEFDMYDSSSSSDSADPDYAQLSLFAGFAW